MSLNTTSHKFNPSLQTGLTATGTTQATAFPLTNNTLHEFTTVASSTGAVLPTPFLPTEVTITNDGLNSLLVYPALGGMIANGTANAAVTLTSGSSITYWASSGTNWYALNAASSGGGASVGGSAGQIEFNSSGVFGGFTASGDATINTATGAVTVTKTNGTAFAPSATTDTTTASNITSGNLPVAQLPSISTHTVLSNTTSGSAAAGANTLTSLIDAALGSTQGDVLYRGASTWAVLAPGTSGQVLQSGGAAANPSWSASAAGNPGGSNGQIQYDNAGSFGGFTASGDATINTTTGAVVVTKTNGTAFAPSATTDTTNASNIASGTLAAARLPLPTGSTLGGVESLAAVTSNWINTISTGGVPSASQPAFTDISGVATLAQLPTIATHTLLSNTTSGTAAPAGNTLTSLIDAAIASTQGDVLYRGSSTWVALAPGTSGQVLTSGGASANPSWGAGGSTAPGGSTTQLQYNNAGAFGGAADVTVGSDGNLNLVGISHGTVAAGDLWYPSSDQGTFAIGRASGIARLGGCIFSCGACTPVSNSTTATSIFGSPTNPKGSLTIPANTLAIGNLLRWYLNAEYGCTGSSPTITFTVYLNGTAIMSPLGAATLTAAETAMPALSTSLANYTFYAVGASGAGCGAWQHTFVSSAGGFINATMYPGGATPTFQSLPQTNANALFDIQIQWSAASATNTYQVKSFALFLDN